jgi:hypothetical protein
MPHSSFFHAPQASFTVHSLIPRTSSSIPSFLSLLHVMSVHLLIRVCTPPGIVWSRFVRWGADPCRMRSGHVSPIVCMGVTVDEPRVVITASADGSVRVWEHANWEQVRGAKMTLHWCTAVLLVTARSSEAPHPSFMCAGFDAAEQQLERPYVHRSAVIARCGWRRCIHSCDRAVGGARQQRRLPAILCDGVHGCRRNRTCPVTSVRAHSHSCTLSHTHSLTHSHTHSLTHSLTRTYTRARGSVPALSIRR